MNRLFTGQHYIDASCLGNYKGVLLGKATSMDIDSTFKRDLEQMVDMYGIRAVLLALAQVTDGAAEKAAGDCNIVLAKQWAAWSVAIEAAEGGTDD